MLEGMKGGPEGVAQTGHWHGNGVQRACRGRQRSAPKGFKIVF